MGTNYYTKDRPPCPECGHEEVGEHIGKSSFGWVFLLRVDMKHGPRSLEDWKAKFSLPGCRIVDEYGKAVTFDEMLKVVTDRSAPGELSSSWYRENYAEPGPNGLARPSVGRDPHCVGHGEGTWSLVTGEFS